MRCGPPTGLTTYRQVCAQVAREFDITACFMCKPFMGVSANGCHHNISLWKGGKDEFKPLGNDPENLPGLKQNYMYRRGGENTFMPDTGDVQLGQTGLWAIGGIVKHLGGLTAIGCSTVNSYRRLWDTGFWHRYSPTGVPEPYHGVEDLGARPLNIGRWIRWSILSDGGGTAARHG